MFDCSQHQIHHRFPSPTTAPVVTENRADFFFYLERPGQVLDNMLEKERNYAEVSHQTQMARFKATRQAERNVCVFEKGVLKKTLYEQSGGMLKHAHTHTNLTLTYTPKLPPDLCMLVVVVSSTAPSQAAVNEWMENNWRASGVPGNG